MSKHPEADYWDYFNHHSLLFVWRVKDEPIGLYRIKLRRRIAHNLRSDMGKGRGNKAWKRADRIDRASRHNTVSVDEIFRGIL